MAKEMVSKCKVCGVQAKLDANNLCKHCAEIYDAIAPRPFEEIGDTFYGDQ